MKVRVSFRILMGSIIAAGIFLVGLVIGMNSYEKDESLYLKSIQRGKSMSNVEEEQHFDDRKKPHSKKHLQISESEDHKVLDSHLKRVFPEGYAHLKDEVKAIELLRFSTSYLRLRNNIGNATKMLNDGYAICGGMALVFKVLARETGLPARYLGTFNLPNMGSHSAVEVYYDDSWHFFDPTFGFFFYSKASYDGDGKIVSFREIASDPQSYYCFKVLEKPWVGRYDNKIKQFGVKPVEANYLESEPFYRKPLMEMYLENLKRNFPIGFGAEHPLSMPIDVDLTGEPSYQFGMRNQSYADMATCNPRYSGSHYLSSEGVDVPPLYHTWFVKTRNDNRLVVEYFLLSGDGKLLTEPLRGVLVVSSKQEQNSLKVVLRTNDDFVAFKIYCEKGTWLIDSINIEYAQE